MQNKLDNVQHALDSLKDKPDLHPHDLLPLRRKLAEVDNLYHEAKFDVPSPKGKGRKKEGGGEGEVEGGAGAEGGIPEGQAVRLNGGREVEERRERGGRVGQSVMFYFLID